MQLIALNVGLQAGIVNSELFTALVLVALVTTLMAAPALSLLDRTMPMPVEPVPAELEAAAAPVLG
jgi:Kef-type K+ transport system membrane component KefB